VSRDLPAGNPFGPTAARWRLPIAARQTIARSLGASIDRSLAASIVIWEISLVRSRQRKTALNYLSQCTRARQAERIARSADGKSSELIEREEIRCARDLISSLPSAGKSPQSKIPSREKREILRSHCGERKSKCNGKEREKKDGRRVKGKGTATDACECPYTSPLEERGRGGREEQRGVP